RLSGTGLLGRDAPLPADDLRHEAARSGQRRAHLGRGAERRAEARPRRVLEDDLMGRAALALVAPLLVALIGCRDAGGTPPVAAAGAPPETVAVAALGRIQPKGGVRRISGPARSAAVIGEVLVEPGDAVRRGQRLAVLEDFGALQA